MNYLLLKKKLNHIDSKKSCIKLTDPLLEILRCCGIGFSSAVIFCKIKVSFTALQERPLPRDIERTSAARSIAGMA